MNIQPIDSRWIAFEEEDLIFPGDGREELVTLAYNAGDFLLAIDDDGIIRDISASKDNFTWLEKWIGKAWRDTVSVESQPKIDQIMKAPDALNEHERQVNHVHDNEMVTVSYRLFRFKNSHRLVAVAKDLRPVTELQQRMLLAQQALERDYLTLRQTEARYRLLFQTIATPAMIVDAQTRTIQQANDACASLFGRESKLLTNGDFLTLLDDQSRNIMLGYLGALSVSTSVAPITVRSAPSGKGKEGREITVKASLFRQGNKGYLLVTISSEVASMRLANGEEQQLEALLDTIPDAFVLTDERLDIVYANPAFAELLHVYAIDQIVGLPLDQFVGRPAVDLNLLRRELDDSGTVRNFASIVNDMSGQTDQVEISAAKLDGTPPSYAFVIRGVARRERDLEPTLRSELQSVDQLTSLVGRKSMKQIVRESTDLIESMCIQAALKHTSDNRALAAEILGISRQSLYSKINRFELNGVAADD